MASVWIIQTGCANVASVCAAFRRLGATPRVTADAAALASEPLVVLPGVGAFGAAMKSLRASGLDATIRERVSACRPLLAICLGLQLLCEASEESPGVAGLSIVPGTLRRFAGEVRVPQMGWNLVTPTPGAVLLREDACYFANSYALAGLPPGWEGATSNYAGAFVAALERGPLLACQFHPELSGRAGLDLIRRWMDLALSAHAAGGPAVATRRGASIVARPSESTGARAC